MITLKALMKSKGLFEITLRKVGVGKRFFLIFLLLSFIPMLLIGMLTFNKTQSSIENKVSKYCIQINRGIRSNFDLLFKKIDEFTVEVIYNKELQAKITQLLQNRNDPDDVYFISNDIREHLKGNVVLNRKAISKTSIVTRDKKRISYDIDTMNYLKASRPDIITKELYTRALDAKGKLVWNTIAKEDVDNIFDYPNMDFSFQVTRAFSLVKKDGSIAGVFSILYSSQYLSSVYNDFVSEGDVYLIDDNNTILFTNRKEYLFKQFPYAKQIDKCKNILKKKDNVYFEKVQGENILLTYSTSKVNGWGVIFTTPYSPLVKDNKEFGMLIIIVSVILLLVSGIVALIFASSVSNPLKRLIKVTKIIKTGRFDVKDEVHGNDEITDLSIAFNDMIGRVDELIKEVYEAKIREKDFKLKALQAQINPHFLYNTLDAIRWAARKKKDYDVSRRIETLSNLFRLILSDDNTITSFDQEIKYTEYYLFFQEQSYKDRLGVEWDIDESVRQYKTVKLLLQPIVENCIVHGMKPDKSQLNIRILIKEKYDGIYIRIDDDGVGADRDYVISTLERIVESKGHIALKNVNDRIKEYFGESCGLKFYSEIGKGTTVEIIVPKKT